jgi:hypothetical protein
VLEPSVFEFEMATETLGCFKSWGINEIPAKYIEPGGKAVGSGIHKLINCIWNKQNCSAVEAVSHCTHL